MTTGRRGYVHAAAAARRAVGLTAAAAAGAMLLAAPATAAAAAMLAGRVAAPTLALVVWRISEGDRGKREGCDERSREQNTFEGHVSVLQLWQAKKRACGMTARCRPPPEPSLNAAHHATVRIGRQNLLNCRDKPAFFLRNKD
jgi:hypothetical protein